MRTKIIGFLKKSPFILKMAWAFARFALKVWGLFVRVDNKHIIFASFGGRKFDDSPKAIYDEILKRDEFKDYKLVWAFVNPDDFTLPRGEKITIDTPRFFKELLKSKVWVSNSEMDRGIKLRRKKTVMIETWHGAPLKKIGGEENQNSMIGKLKPSKNLDSKTIRCAQSDFDKEVFKRIFQATDSAFIVKDLPRNDKLLNYNDEEILKIKKELSLPLDKKIILYTPTYREYLVDENYDNYIAPPMSLDKWKEKLSDNYVLLIRAHYAVSKALNLVENDFVRDVSKYPYLNDLYIVSDLMISDYSSTFFDYSILDRPMLCFAYDLDEYEEKRGLYLDLNETLPCDVCFNEDDLINQIINLDFNEASRKTSEFHHKFAPFAGHASEAIVDELEKRLNLN